MADTVKSESQLGRLVVERKLVTPEELNTCIREQQSLAKDGKNLSLHEVLVQSGYVTRSQLERLGGDMEDSIAAKPAQIPGFQVLQKLGEGAMAKVVLAKQLSLDRLVAIKILPAKMCENQEFVERFKKEGKAAAKLNHNNIVQAIDVGEANGRYYFVMEYVDGKTVFDDLASGKPYPEREALRIIIQVARALEHASARGFIHRDVKPKNIMLTKDGVAKLADMGLARRTSDLKAAAKEAGRAYGTPYYISPEQVRGEVHIDFRADMYSLGATLYHMVTGRVPFDGPSPAAVMHKHLTGNLTPADHVNTRLTTGLGEVIERMMAKDPKQRYSSWADLIHDLEAVERGEAPPQARRQYDDKLLEGLSEGAPATVSAPVAPVPEEPAGPVVSLIWVIVLGTLLGISVILNLVLVLTR